MNWEKKHDIILNWIDSCKTFEQLTNVVHFVKRQTFETSDLLRFCKLKSMAIHASLICDTLQKQYDFFKSKYP